MLELRFHELVYPATQSDVGITKHSQVQQQFGTHCISNELLSAQHPRLKSSCVAFQKVFHVKEKPDFYFTY